MYVSVNLSLKTSYDRNCVNDYIYTIIILCYCSGIVHSEKTFLTLLTYCPTIAPPIIPLFQSSKLPIGPKPIKQHDNILMTALGMQVFRLKHAHRAGKRGTNRNTPGLNVNQMKCLSSYLISNLSLIDLITVCANQALLFRCTLDQLLSVNS